MAIRKVLEKAHNLHNELDYIEYRIIQLSSLGGAMINNNFEEADLIMETLPVNGARPFVTPIYPASAYQLTPLEMVDSIPKENPYPIGFQRAYREKELEDSPILTVFMSFDKSTILSLVDLALQKLKERRQEIYNESKIILRAHH